MHGSVYTPKKEVDEDRAFVVFHEGAGVRGLNLPRFSGSK